ncbi:MAG TPA: YbaK/EbsC family protein [Acidimicrobiales bacterium]|jgi:prolyl-tRNA editing enzyme YbaK/EbsC (Cys-tRNA(Pro) deacylase)|nr:YbaK/EbsC family protein [Acidimicrobiales bacterium]
MHPSAQRVADVLAERGATGRVREFTQATKTSQQAAAALGCDLGAIASCLVFLVDGQAVIVIKSGRHRVDTERLAAAARGATARQATPDEVRRATGQPIGGVSPVGWPAPMRAFIDESLTDYDVIWSAAGTPNAVFPTTYAELAALTGATPLLLS